MDKQQLTFNDIPVALGEILERLERIGAILSELKTGTNDEDNKWMNIEEFIEYLPNHPSKGISYKWACGREIPFHKQGKYV